MRLLRQWVLSERTLSQALANPRQNEATDTKHDQLREALSYFRIARNFRGISKKTHRTKKYTKQAREVATSVLHALGEMSKPTVATVAESVKTLANQWHDGKKINQDNISAASKLLWLRFGDPVIIFDKRNRQAVGAHLDWLDTRIKKSHLHDYTQYCEAWGLCFAHYEASINSAIAWLKRLPENARPVRIHESEYQATINTRWFPQRVLDIFLWEHA